MVIGAWWHNKPLGTKLLRFGAEAQKRLAAAVPHRATDANRNRGEGLTPGKRG